jgi:hypothetical protein
MQVVSRLVEKKSNLANPPWLPNELESNRKLSADHLPFILHGALAGASSLWGYYIDCYLGPSTIRRSSQIWQFHSRKVEISLRIHFFHPEIEFWWFMLEIVLIGQIIVKKKGNLWWGIWICITICWNFAPRIGFPMDGALVNAGSHNPPSNVLYMLHKALPRGRALPKSGDCMRWSQVQPCH